MVLIGFLAAGLPALHTAGAWAGDIRLAKVNGETITLERLLEDFRARHGGHLSLLVGEEPLRQFLESEVDDLLMVQEGRRLEIDRRPQVVEEVASLKRRKAMEALLQREVRGQVRITPEDVRDALQKLETGYRIRWIHVPERAAAEAAEERIRKGERFEAVARELSRDPSARNGGDPGPFTWGGANRELENLVMRLQPGEVSPVFQDAGGFALVTVEERMAPDEPPAGPRVEAMIRTILRNRREKDLRRKLVATLRERAGGVTIRAEALDLERLRRALAGQEESWVVATIGEKKMFLSDLAWALDFEAWADLPEFLFKRRVRAAVEEAIDRMLLGEEGLRRNSGGPVVQLEVQGATDRMVLGILLKEFVLRGIQPGQADLATYYHEHANQFRRPDRYHLQHIIVADRARAVELRTRLAGRDGEAFAASAREVSLDRQTAENGGDLGWIPEARLSSSIKGILQGLKPGDLSQVIETSAGFAVIRLVEKESGSPQPLEMVREQVKRAWTRSAGQAARAEWLDRLRRVASIRIDQEALKRASREMADRANRHLLGFRHPDPAPEVRR